MCVVKECASDSTSLSDQTLSFIKTHPLMDRAVPAAGRGPQLIQTNLRSVLTISDYCSLVTIDYCGDMMTVGSDLCELSCDFNGDIPIEVICSLMSCSLACYYVT